MEDLHEKRYSRKLLNAWPPNSQDDLIYLINLPVRFPNFFERLPFKIPSLLSSQEKLFLLIHFGTEINSIDLLDS